MLDWLAEQYVIQLVRWVLFLENPTSCPWILSFQVWTTILASVWAIRSVYFTRKAHLFKTRTTDAEFLNPRLIQATRRVKRKLAWLAGNPIARIWTRRLLKSVPVVTARSQAVVLCNVGFSKPTVMISDTAVKVLDDSELEASLAHEMSHVLQRDNLVRLILEGFAFAVPAIFWWYVSLHMVVGSTTDFLSMLFVGLLLGTAVRFGLLPLVSYWQETRCDEWAGRVVGDRLVVASALVKIGKEANREERPLRISPALTPFALFHFQVSRRAKRLVSGTGKHILMLDRWGGRATKIVVGVFIVVGVLAVQRAGERELSARVQIMPGYAGIEVLEGADQLRAIYPALQAEKKTSFLSGLSPVNCVEFCVTETQSQICDDPDCKLGSDCSVLPENCFEACSPEVLAAVLGWNQESRESAVKNP